MSEEEIVKALTNAMPHDILVNTNWTLYKDTKAKDIEIERLHKELHKYRYTPKVHFKETMELREETKRLNNIIKEAREYIEKNKRNLFLDVSEDFLDHDELVDRRIGKELLEILDKVEEK